MMAQIGGGPFFLTVLENTENSCDTNYPLTAAYVSGSGPSHGTLTSFGSDGSFTYVPASCSGEEKGTS